MKRISLYLLSSAVVFASGALFLWAADPARSDGPGKQEQVFRHSQSKDILPFKDILKAVRPFIHGEVIETEFEVEDGRAIYEFKYIDKSGRVRELYVNAKTGKIIKDETD